MAEDKTDREGLSGLLPWTVLFKGFQVALDLNKLLLAAAGILVMFLGWWLLALVFATGEAKEPPQWDRTVSWGEFRAKRDHWNLMHEAMGLTTDPELGRYQVEDIAETLDEYEAFKNLKVTGAEAVLAVRARAAELAKSTRADDKEAAARF